MLLDTHMGNSDSFEKVRQSVVTPGKTMHTIDLSEPMRVHEDGFGDTWMRLCYLINACKAQNKIAKICWGSGPCPYCPTGTFESKNIAIAAALKMLDGGNLVAQVVNQKGVKLSMAGDFYVNNFCRTHLQWKCNPKFVCYQFDGRNHPQKAIAKKDQKRLLCKLENAGYRPINCGNEQPIEHIVEHLANCAFFVGVASGISLVALSVGTPTHIILNDLPAKVIFQHYNNKPLNYHIRLHHFLRQLESSSVKYM